MADINPDRRALLQLAVMAAPALTASAWAGQEAKRRSGNKEAPFRFHGARDGIHWASADGLRSGLFLPLGTAFALTPGSISPDLGHLAYSALDRRTGSNIWTVSIRLRDGMPVAGKPTAIRHSGTFDVQPRFSPDGRRISWAAREAGSWSLREQEFRV